MKDFNKFCKIFSIISYSSYFCEKFLPPDTIIRCRIVGGINVVEILNQFCECSLWFDTQLELQNIYLYSVVSDTNLEKIRRYSWEDVIEHFPSELQEIFIFNLELFTKVEVS